MAPLDRLAGWGVPLLRPYGEMLALKGDTAEEELHGARAALSKLGVVDTEVLQVGEGIVDPLSTVVRVVAGESPGRARFAAKRAKAARTGALAGGAEGGLAAADPPGASDGSPGGTRISSMLGVMGGFSAGTWR
ncbi:hypothetical protein SCALM49S_00952 [Streptomyces californicus]